MNEGYMAVNDAKGNSASDLKTANYTSDRKGKFTYISSGNLQ